MAKEHFGQYKVDGELGRGGMGVVYKAHDGALGRHVAIKVLSEQLATDDAVVERFKREAKSMAALNDARIIQIYFIGEDEGQPYFVMEYVEGESLSQRLKRDGSLSVSESLNILRQTAQGLALAHRRGVVHRDIKPGNLMLTTEGKVKIADFGIAMVQDLSKRLTNTGEFVGTPGYLSPEVCVGQPVDQRSDIFALGIVLYEMLTGNIPFTEASPLGMMLEVVKAEIPDVRTVNAEVDDRTCQILARMIAKDPNHRYQDCGELLADLTGSAPVAAAAAAGDGGKFESARTTALSQLEALPELGGNSAATVVSVPGGQPNPVMAPAATGSAKRRMLPLAVAALLLMGVAGAVIFVFQDQLLGSSEPEQRLSAAQNIEPERSPLAATGRDAVGPDDGAGEKAEGSVEDGADLERDLLLAAGASNADSAQDKLQLASAAGATGEDQASARGPGKTLAANTATADPAPVQLQISPPANEPQANEPQATKEPVQLASIAKPAPTTAAAPRAPRLVVVALGDRAIAGPVEQLLENELLNEKLTVMDEAFFPDIGRYTGEQGLDLAGLSRVIQDNGGDVLVLAEIDYLGETPLQYYGQYSTLFSVNVKIRNILLNERRPLGPGWSSKVDFTSLNADEKAREAVEPILNQVSDSLRDLKVKG